MKVTITLLLLSITLLLQAQTICIDPGHGFGPGGENLDGRTYEEISTNCEVGLLLRDSLENSGYTVIMTRETSDTNSWVSLTQRAEIADEYESDWLLSIHCNGGGGTGTETFWCHRASPNRAKDSIFAKLVQDQMAFYGDWKGRRSIEDALYLGFHLGVLKGTAPGCLNEIGFVDTPDNLEKLLDYGWQQKFAQAYRVAIDLSFEQEYPSSIKSNMDNKLIIYPNPCRDHIVLSGASPGISHIDIYNLLGELELTFNFDTIVMDKIALNTQQLLPGAYILRLNHLGSKPILFIKQ